MRTTLPSFFSPYRENLAVEGAVTWKVDVNFEQSICDDEILVVNRKGNRGHSLFMGHVLRKSAPLARHSAVQLIGVGRMAPGLPGPSTHMADKQPLVVYLCL